MNRKIQFSLVATTAIAAVLSNPAYAQQSRSDGGSSVSELENPTYDANTSLGVVTGDNLGNHIADGELNMNGFAVFNMGDPIDPMDGVSLRYLENYVEANGDNLGNHTATKVLNMGGFAITQLPAPTGPTQAANRAYVDTAVAGAGDDLGDHTATENLNMNGHRITRLQDPENAKDAVPLSFLEQYVDDNGDNLGNHAATRDLDMKDFKILNVMDPTEDKDAANKLYVDGVTAGIDDRIDDLEAIEIIAGTGLSGGGDLTQSRTISFSTTWGDGRYALRTRSINAGTGLTGGGNLAGNRTIALNLTYGDNRWINRTANVSISGTKTFTGPVIVNTPTADNHAANKGYVDDAADGAIDSLIAGDGLTKTGRTFAVDGTVVRTSGNQTINGVKNFGQLRHYDETNESNGSIRFGRNANQYLDFHGGTDGNFVTSVSPEAHDKPLVLRVQNGALEHNFRFSTDGQLGNIEAPTDNKDAANKAYVDAAAAAAIGTTYTAGTGLNLAGAEFSFNTAFGDGRYALRGRNLVAGDGLTGGGTLAANRTFAVDGSVVRTSRSIATGTGLSGGGNLGANRTLSFNTTWGDGRYALRSRTLTAGTGLTGGGNLGANRTLSFNTTWGDGRYALRSRTLTAGTGLTGGGSLAGNRTFNFDTTWGDKRYAEHSDITGSTNYDSILGGTTTSGARTFHHSQGGAPADAPTAQQQVGLRLGSPWGRTDVAFPNDNDVNRGFFRTGTSTNWAEFVTSENIGSFVAANETTYTAGTGLTLSGGQFHFSTTWGDARYALRGRTLTAGDGLTGGGTLAANRTFAVDSSVVRTSRSIATGTGLTGGGNLSANRTFAVDNTVFRTGLAVAGNLRFASANGRGMRFYDNDAYKIYMSAQGDTTWGGRLDTASDYNMYFRMGNGTTRGFVFKNGNDAIFQIAGDGRVYSTGGYRSSGDTGWYNETHGGGWYMQDATWLRSYNNKNIFTGGQVRADGGIMVGTTLSINSNGSMNAGNKNIINVATPTAGTHAANKAYVDAKVSAQPDADTTYTAGTGLVESSQVFSFDTAWGDGRYALRGRSLTAGDGLTGGGTLAANRTFAVDSSVVRTARAINTGTGLSGGGNLGVNRTISFNTSWGDARYALRARTIAAGTGLSGGGNLAGNRTISFNTNWGDTRYTQNASIDGATTYDVAMGGTGTAESQTFYHSQAGRPSDSPLVGQHVGIRMGSPWGRTDMAFPNQNDQNRGFFRTGTSTEWSEIVTSDNIGSMIGAGTGLNRSSNTLSFDASWGDGRYALRARSIAAGTGLTGGGDLAANRTLAFNTTWGDARYVNQSGNETISGTKTFSSTIAGNITGLAGRATRLATPRSINGQAFDGTASIGIDYIASRGVLAPETGRNVHSVGVYTFNQHDNNLGTGTPSGYWSVLGFGRGANGSVQLAGNWANGGNELYFRSLRNTVDNWYDWKEIVHSGNIASYVADNETTYAAGTGLAKSGSTFSFDTSWGDGRYALRWRTLTAGDGLTGGGTLAANRTFAVDSSVVRTSRAITAGTGLTGGGNLGANRSLAFDTTWGDARYALRGRAVNTGTGLTGGGNLAANRTISVDGTVFRTGAAIGGNLRFASGDGRGMRFWDSDNYKIYMSAQDTATWGGRLDTASDYNMYFRMAGGNNRGFVFKNGTTPVFQIAGNGLLLGNNGRIESTQPFVTTNTNGFRMVNGNYASFWRQDGSDMYLMLTDSGDQYGSWNSLRPFYVNMATGLVNMRQGLDMGGDRINNVATPSASTDAANKAYVDSKAGPTYSAGTGISISGTTVNFNTTWGDSRYALRGRTLTAGDGLSGGGNLAANRSFAVDGTVVRTSGNQSIAGVKTFTGEIRSFRDNNAAGTNIRIGRNTTQYMTFHGGSTGNFMTGVSPSGENKPIILRTQSGSVSHNFTFATNGRIGGVANPSAGTDAMNLTYANGTYALRDLAINTGTGLTGGGNLTANRTIALANNYIRRAAGATSAGLLAYNGTTRAAGQLYGGSTNPTSTTRLNYNGSLYATRFYSTAYYYFSDRNLKKDIETIDAKTGIGIVRDLRPVSYAWRENDKKALGVIAQEVEEVIPTAVTTNEAGLKAVDYNQMIAPMLAAIQELDERVQALEEAAN